MKYALLVAASKKPSTASIFDLYVRIQNSAAMSASKFFEMGTRANIRFGIIAQ